MLNPEELLANKDIFDPAHELLTWEKWIRIRKEESKKLAKHTNRTQADLTMHLIENIREDRERKIVLEHSQIKKVPHLRASLWQQQLRLKQNCEDDPIYEVHRNSLDEGRPPIMEHIGVPKLIQYTEKGLSGDAHRKTCEKLDAEYVKYRKQREEQLKESMAKIDPFRPDVSNLVVKGCRPKPPPPKLPPLPQINIVETSQATCDNLYHVYAVQINKTLIFKDVQGQTLTHLRSIQNEEWHESCNSWTYYFNVPQKRAGRAKLFLSNPGTVTLRYCWKKIKRPIPYIPDEPLDQFFFFNQNEDVLFPGENKDVHFTFISPKPGIFSEVWELSFCNVSFFDTLGERFSINLHADCVEDDNTSNMELKVEKLKNKIYSKMVHNIVRYLLDDVVLKATSIEPQLYPYKELFLEAEMFVLKNPVCFYHQTEVTKMKELYLEMLPGEEWDLSVKTWREKMMEKEFDDRMKYFELLKKSHRDFLKPWYEGDELLKQKHVAVGMVLGQLADSFDKEYARVTALYMGSDNMRNSTSTQFVIGSVKFCTIQNVFYVQMYEHVATAIELIAGVLSSLDLNRWIEFDFCRT